MDRQIQVDINRSLFPIFLQGSVRNEEVRSDTVRRTVADVTAKLLARHWLELKGKQKVADAEVEFANIPEVVRLSTTRRNGGSVCFITYFLVLFCCMTSRCYRFVKLMGVFVVVVMVVVVVIDILLSQSYGCGCMHINAYRSRIYRRSVFLISLLLCLFMYSLYYFFLILSFVV